MGAMAALIGAPIVTAMAAGGFFLGIGINLVAWILFLPFSPTRAEQSASALRECFRLFCTAAFMIPTVAAPFPGWVLLLSGMLPDAAFANAPVPSMILILWGLCGCYYGAMGLAREWRWGLPQLQNIRNLPTAKATSAALGLVELRGTARATGGDPILYFKREVLVDEKFDVFAESLYPFDLEDASGRVRVDPSGVPLTIYFPFLSLFTSLLGGRPFFAVLRRRIKHGWWPNREFFLCDGDPVYVLGTIEIERDSKTGQEYRVVRPPSEARHHESVIDSLMSPFRFRTRRSWQDVFVIADTEEAVASKLLARRFRFRVFWSLFWMIGSTGLLTVL
jgi:hypothetical protein